MKTKKIGVKLSLNKITVVNLNDLEKAKVYGGDYSDALLVCSKSRMVDTCGCTEACQTETCPDKCDSDEPTCP